MFIKHTIANDVAFDQDLRMDDHNMDRYAYRHFLIDLIRENSHYNNDSYELSLSNLSLDDQKIFLSHLIDADDYAYYSQNEVRLKKAIEEHEEWMQEELDEMLSTLYQKDMQEMGMKLCHHKDNGEAFWIIR